MEVGFDYPELMPDYCIVCKRFPSKSAGLLVYGKNKKETPWVTTAEPAVASGFKLLFRLFEMLKRTVQQGRLCGLCHELVDRFDKTKVHSLMIMDDLQFRKVPPNMTCGNGCVLCGCEDVEMIKTTDKMKEVTIKFQLYKLLKVIYEDGVVCLKCLKLVETANQLEKEKDQIQNCLVKRINAYFDESEKYRVPTLAHNVANFARYSYLKERRQKARLKQDMVHYQQVCDLYLLEGLDTEGLKKPKIVDSSGEEEEMVIPCSVVLNRMEDTVKEEPHSEPEYYDEPSFFDDEPEYPLEVDIGNRRIKVESSSDSEEERPLKRRKRKKRKAADSPLQPVPKKKKKTNNLAGKDELKQQSSQEIQLIDDEYDYTRGTGVNPVKHIDYSLKLETYYRYPRWNNDHNFVMEILQKQNFDDDFTRGYTKLGGPMLLYRGHLFYRFMNEKQPFVGKIAKWYCIRGQQKSGLRLGFDCKAELATTWDEQYVVLESVYNITHNHQLNQNIIKHFLIKLHIRKLLQFNPDASNLAIRNRVLAVQGPITHIKNLCAVVKSMRARVISESAESRGILIKKAWGITKKDWGNWNTPDYVKKVLENKNFDACTLVRSTRSGGRVLIYKGHHFLQDKPSYFTMSLITKWYCAKIFPDGVQCPVRIVTTKDMQNVVLESVNTEHNHESNPAMIQELIVRHHMRRLIKQNLSESSESIWNKAKAKLGDEEIAIDEEFQAKYVRKLQLRYLAQLDKGKPLSDSEEEDKKKEKKFLVNFERKTFHNRPDRSIDMMMRAPYKRIRQLAEARASHYKEGEVPYVQLPDDGEYKDWMSEDFIQGVIERKNFDFNSNTIIMSNDTPGLIHNGFLYHPSTWDDFPTSRIIQIWRCGFRGEGVDKYNEETWCRAQVITLIENGAVLKESLKKPHSHNSEGKRIAQLLFKGIMRDNVKRNPNLNNREILNMTVEMNKGLQVGKTKSLLGQIRYYQLKYHNFDIPSRARRKSSAAYLSGVRRGKKIDLSI